MGENRASNNRVMNTIIGKEMELPPNAPSIKQGASFTDRCVAE